MRQANWKRMWIPVLALLLALAAGCGNKVAIPDWVQGEVNKPYPSIRFLVGVGQGDDLQTAQDRARAEITKQFTVKVSSLIESLEQYTGMEGDRQSNWLLKTTVSQLTKTAVDETVNGIEMRQTFVHPETGQAYALAVIQRNKAQMRLSTRILDLDAHINSLVKLSDDAPDIFRRLRPLIAALEVMKEREVLNNQLTVVNATGNGIDPVVRPADLDKRLDTNLAKLKVAVVVEGDRDGRVRKAIIRSLNGGGVQVRPDRQGADILVAGKLRGVETNPDNNTGFVFAKFEASLELTNTHDGATFGVVEHSYRDGANTTFDAEEKAIARMSELIVRDFNDKLYAYMTL